MDDVIEHSNRFCERVCGDGYGILDGELCPAMSLIIDYRPHSHFLVIIFKRSLCLHLIAEYFGNNDVWDIWVGIASSFH